MKGSNKQSHSKENSTGCGSGAHRFEDCSLKFAAKRAFHSPTANETLLSQKGRHTAIVLIPSKAKQFRNGRRR